jgi:type VI secretion system secreted protein Hcp
MSIYLQLPNIKGNVSAKYYQGWIECDSFNFGTNRWVVTQPGYVQNRIRSIATATELTVTKSRPFDHPFIPRVLSRQSHG